MGMTIDEAVMHIMDVICENNTIKHSDLVIFDNEKQALRTAIDTMRKYEKIQDIVERFKNQYDHTTSMDLMMEIKEVVEDGNVN